MKKEMITQKTLQSIVEEYPFFQGYIDANHLQEPLEKGLSLDDYFKSLTEDDFEHKAIVPEAIVKGAMDYIEQMMAFLGLDQSGVDHITIQAGFNKSGEMESFDELIIKPGEIIAIVGPTGSGKSRLLADIEWGAQGDTPTKRKVLINGSPLAIEERFSTQNKLVAQLSQNMNFVMDLTVEEFLQLHAQSRMVENEEEIVEKIFLKANELAGEKFTRTTPVTSLSGGQSRALMIADTAILSTSPIVLIDEIENAGIDRKQALRLLVGEEKIVLMATHDPILALMADKRIVISNGGIAKVMNVTEHERAVLGELEKLDQTLLSIRTKMRYGEQITVDLSVFR